MASILVPKTTSKSYFWISFEKRRFTRSLGIHNEIKHFFKTKSSFISFKSLTSLKTALKNYTWKVCVLLQQNAFGRPFSLKKHEEMFCDFAKTSGFFGESRHTKCISLGEIHIHDFSLNRKQADFSGQNSGHLAPREIEDWLKILLIWFNSGSWNQCSKQKGWSSFTQLWRSTNWKVLVPVGEETGGVSNHHTPDGLV